MKSELYTTQADAIAAKLAQAEECQARDREALATAEHPHRQILSQRIAGREGLLATLRRSLAELQGEEPQAARTHKKFFRVSPVEEAQIDRAAEDAGTGVGQYIRANLPCLK